MRNAKELRNDLADVYAKLRAGQITTKEADALANIGGKMIASAKTQLEYYALREEKPEIPWLGEQVDSN